MKRIAWILAMALFVGSFGGPVWAEGDEGGCPDGEEAIVCTTNHQCVEVFYCTACSRSVTPKTCINDYPN